MTSWEAIVREYSYMNFPAAEIAEWLAPRLALARRAVILDESGGEAARLLLSAPALARVPFAGVWIPPEAAGGWRPPEGIPLLPGEPEIASARPDCLIPIFRRQDGAPLDLARLRDLTGAAVVDSVLFNNPFAGSMTLRYSGRNGPGLGDPAIPPNLRQSFQRHVQRYFFAMQLAQGKRVLDCACGCGYGTHILSRVAREAVGLDLNAHLVGYARRYNAAPNVRYAAGDLIDFPESGGFDLVTSVETFEHVPEARLDDYVRALRRLLRPGGTLLCTTPKAAATFRSPPNRQHVAEYSTEDFLARLSAQLRVVKVLFQTHDGRFLDALPSGHPLPDSTQYTHVVQIALAVADGRGTGRP